MPRKILQIALLSAIMFPACAAQSESPDPLADTFLGLWHWTHEARKPAVQVHMTCSDSDCDASINGATIKVIRDGATLRALAETGINFEGTIRNNPLRIDGYLKQYESDFAFYTAMTPITLNRTGLDQWSGRTVVQDRDFRMFLDIFENDTGEQQAVLRNPERNEILSGRRPFNVETTPSGDVELVTGSGDWERRIPLKQNADGTLTLDHPWFEDPLVMRRAKADGQIGYHPRPKDNPITTYTPPPLQEDGWTVAAAESLGFDPSPLNDLVETIATANPQDNPPLQLHAILASHQGTLFLEEYFFGHDATSRHDVRSLGKVFGSVMLGALINDGYEVDLDARPVVDLLTAKGEAIEDLRKADITLSHVLTYTTGLDCHASDDSVGSEDRMWSQTEEPDFWSFFARLPQLHEPGERYAYCSGSANMVGHVIRSLSDMPVLDVFDTQIAKPLNFGPYHWNTMPSGEAYLGGGAYMRPRDILKVGTLYVQDGDWNGAQIVDPDWIETSTQSKVPITAGTTGLSEEDFNNNYFGGGQAFIWRTDTVRVGDMIYQSYEASGNGGQLIINVPELDLSVVMVGGNYRQGYVWGRWRNELVGQYVIPAILAAQDQAGQDQTRQ
ncbi:MAG: serine hydrolase [Pseudomonadota bacterium]